MPPSRPAPTDPSPARQAQGRELLDAWIDLDAMSDHPIAVTGRERLQREAKAMGQRLVTVEITYEPLPDPSIDALPAPVQERIAEVARRVHEDPASQRAELETLVRSYPQIPVLRNHLACALSAAGEQARADALIAETARLFPDYLFGFCNHIMQLLHEDKIEQARALLETGPRGPRLMLHFFDPTRTVYHASEAVTYAAMVGHYFLATHRLDAAKLQLKLLKDTEPDHRLTKHLAKCVRQYARVKPVLDALERLKDRPRRTRAKKPRASRAGKAEKPGLV